MSLSTAPLNFVMSFLTSGNGSATQDRISQLKLAASIFAYSDAARAAQSSSSMSVTSPENVKDLADRISDTVEKVLALDARAREDAYNAVEQNPFHLRDAGAAIQNDRTIVLKALKKD